MKLGILTAEQKGVEKETSSDVSVTARKWEFVLTRECV